MMGGDIGLDSVPGKGSTFWFTVKLQPEAAPPQPAASSPQITFEGYRVLVADEHAEHQDLLGLQLRAWRAETQHATTREQAFKILREAAAEGMAIDCVIIDHAFARGGLAFVAGLHRTPPCPLPKFVMLASVTALQETGQWLNAGIDVYVSKPIRQSELQSALAKCLLDPPAESTDAPMLDHTTSMDRMSTLPSEAPALPTFDAKLLVAEDNLVNQELMRGMLEGFGCRFEIADNGAEAVSAIVEHELDLRHDPFKLLLMDCQMPELDGFEATRKLREYERQSGRPRLPIVAITANALSGDRERCLEAGMDDYLTKPFTRAQLQAVLERWLPLESTVTRAALPRAGEDAPARPTRAAGSQLDLEALRRIRALQRPGTPDILNKVVTLFENAAPRQLKAMQEALAGADGEALKRAAHSLKSSSASLGAGACAQLCRELEALGAAGDLAAAGPKVDVLEFELDGALTALRYQVKRGGAAAA
jgi:CheY-like chemotaxis protein